MGLKKPSMVVVGLCGRCGDPITAAEAKIFVEGKRVCEACEALAKHVKEQRCQNLRS